MACIVEIQQEEELFGIWHGLVRKPSEKDISDWDMFEDSYPSPNQMVGDDEYLFENGTNPFAFGK
jgi:hypothetical protein